MKKAPASSCPCGSGRKYARCCAPAGPARLQALLQEAMNWQEQGQVERAMARYQSVLKNDKRNAPASYLCGTVYQQKGDFKRAIIAFERAFKLGLKDPEARVRYVYTLLSAGQSEQAIKVLEKLLAKQPDHDQARYLLANVCFESELFQQAANHYRQLTITQKVDWRIFFNLGQTLYQQSLIPEAIEQFVAALALNKTNPEILASLATVCQLDNRLEESRQYAQQALDLQPDNVGATIVIVRLLRGEKLWSKAQEALDKVEPANLEPGDQVLWWQEQGRLLDGIQKYEEAFDAFSRSRRLLRDIRNIKYDVDLLDKQLADTETCFSKSKPDISLASTGLTDYPQPLFIVGFYRSGTTLLEQMLTSHENICGVGETPAMATAEDSMEALFGRAYPMCFNKGVFEKHKRALQQMGNEYRNTVAELDGFQQKAHLMVDKYLFNMLRLPLIHMIFPASPVIHMVRHPLDVVISTYSTLFLERNEWTYDLQDIARVYVRCFRHVQKMRDLLDLRYYCLQYEELVENPEKELKELLEFCREDWDKNCLTFYNNERVARTASYEQVQRKLYTGAKYRYKNYLNFIDKQVVQILEPVIQEMGYRIDN